MGKAAYENVVCGFFYCKLFMEYHSVSYYNPKYKDEVVSAMFYPLKEVEIDKVIEAGKRYWWKLFGAIPIFPYIAKEDKYEPISSPFKKNFNKTFEDLKKHGSSEYLKNDAEEKIYTKAKVEIRYMRKSGAYTYCEDKWFDTNEQARQYYDKIIGETKKN